MIFLHGRRKRVETGHMQRWSRVHHLPKTPEIPFQTFALLGEIPPEHFVYLFGPAGDNIFEIRMREDHSVACFAREINRMDSLAHAQKHEHHVEHAVAFVREPAGEMKAHIEGDSLDAESRQRSAEDRGFFEEKHAFAALRENARGGQARDAAAHDDGVVRFHVAKPPLMPITWP